jgi:hypothetical protein
MIGTCADCGEEALLIACADNLSRCGVCTVLNGYCLECGAFGTVTDDNPVYACLCADCRREAWDSYRTENATWRLWDIGR